MKPNIGDQCIVEVDGILKDQDGNELYTLKGVYNTFFDADELADLGSWMRAVKEEEK